MDSIVALVFGLICVVFGASMIRDPNAPDKFWYPEDNPTHGRIARRVVQMMGGLCLLFGIVVSYFGSGL